MGAKKTEPNPRRGRVRKGDGKPAAHEAGSAAAPVGFDEGAIAEELRMHWRAGAGDQFLVCDDDGRWSEWPMQAVVDLMRSLPHRMVAIKVREGEMLSEVKRVFLHVRKHRRFDHVFDALPGYASRDYTIGNGKRVLVKTSPMFVKPVQGEWPLIRKICEGLFDEQPALRQLDYIYSWLKVSADSAMHGTPGHWRPGHCLIMPGPIGAGKGFFQEHVITPLLGGRMADPEKMLFGLDEYNSDCWGAEHLALGEVPMPSQKMHDRIALSEKIKQIVANTLHRMRVMRMDPLALYPFWRLTISVNDHPDKLRNLPLITDDFRDKVILVHCRKMGMPMPTSTLAERIAFSTAVAAEIPHFLHWLLNEWEIPKDLLTYEDGKDATRFGFREFHHPIIKEGLFEDTADAQLLALVDHADFMSAEHWDGPKKLWELPTLENMNASKVAFVWHQSAETLQQLLTGEGGCVSSVASMAKKLFAHNRCSWMLGRLVKDDKVGQDAGYPRIAKEAGGLKADTRLWKGWFITRPEPVRS